MPPRRRPAGPPEVIVLPGANSAEGIATGAGSTFYAGELFTGDIFRGDLQVPTTVARHGILLAAVNAKFDTGFPPTADTYEVVIVKR